MTRFRSSLIALVAAGMLCMVFSKPVPAQKESQLVIADASICLDVVDLSCVGENKQFPAEAGRVYCTCRVLGAINPTSVTHVWYYGDKEKASVKLDVRSPDWRTYSSKRILPKETGEWHVDILGPKGELLKEIPFTITP